MVGVLERKLAGEVCWKAGPGGAVTRHLLLNSKTVHNYTLDLPFLQPQSGEFLHVTDHSPDK
jgi:hypothetical protein